MHFRRTCLWLLGAALIAFAHPAAAQSGLPIKAFFGTYTGSAVAENKDSAYFAVTARDLDMVIHPEGTGFSISWTTVAHEGGDPAKPKVKRKEDRVVFVPGAAEGIWRTADEPDPLSGNPYVWARNEGSSLIVYVLTIDSRGRYEMQRYVRTLTGGAMDLTFVSIHEGERTRTVKGKLIRTGN